MLYRFQLIQIFFHQGHTPFNFWASPMPNKSEVPDVLHILH